MRRLLFPSLLLALAACAVDGKDPSPTPAAGRQADRHTADEPAPPESGNVSKTEEVAGAIASIRSEPKDTQLPAPSSDPSLSTSLTTLDAIKQIGAGGADMGIGLGGVPLGGARLQTRDRVPEYGRRGGPLANADKPARPMARPAEPGDFLVDGNEGARFERATEPAAINDLVDTRTDALSTFAVDVDTGSFTLARRMLKEGGLPQPHLVRVEEWVNAFGYSYRDPSSEHPFEIHVQAAPLAKQSYVMRVGIQGKRIDNAARKPTHLTFLVDTSGSMRGEDRLELAKRSLKLLVQNLDQRDSVAIATYAGDSRLVLAATKVTGESRGRILSAIDSLDNGGGTAMASGMDLAYREATKGLADKPISRVIVLSDGDANIGRSGPDQILQAIKGYVSEGVTLSTVGFGMGNYRDDMMERLADAGNGNYTYIDSIDTAKKAFGENLAGTLQVIAQDTKIQVVMNPDVVKSYRLIGYENRNVRDQDFRDDKVDAGEIGAGHTVTALYEVQLHQDEPIGDIATVHVRYKQPRGVKATEVKTVLTASMLQPTLAHLDVDGRFAVAVALASESFRNSPHMQRLGLSLNDAVRLGSSAAQGPHAKERREFVELLTPFARNQHVAAR